ncbi:MAG: hypothetical protein JRJ12_15365 [Deltaproteobacteria bacterium]|nr:hypothetical protein [Deltaproteobacteria bacterium]MBW2072355.1 hypothetical protein [Deltaproteobacteria bacterium]
MTAENAASSFLRRHGHTSLVSLGAGCLINRIDNHLRLMAALKLRYYVAVDRAPYIKLTSANIFSDPAAMRDLLTAYYHGKPEKLWQALKLFPGTWVEDLLDIHCAVVVCQKVYPDCRWEKIILSMTPRLVLQEDLHGCERQQLRGRDYVRTWTKIKQYGLRPFRPWPIFPWERNLILWRRRDFADEEVERSRWKMFWRLCERFIG